MLLQVKATADPPTPAQCAKALQSLAQIAGPPRAVVRREVWWWDRRLRCFHRFADAPATPGDRTPPGCGSEAGRTSDMPTDAPTVEGTGRASRNGARRRDT
jgi:hypothetical protein